LKCFAGNELTNLLRDLIKPNEWKYVATKYYDDVLQGLNAPINSIKFKNKHNFIRELKLAKIDTPRANWDEL
jgi:hypothetical protein